MLKDDHWFKFFYKKFVMSTQGWKDDEVGAYVRLLIHQFDKRGLPDDPNELSKLITSYKKNWPMLSRKFLKEEDGLLRNEFMKGVREERDRKSETNSKNGQNGGRAKTKQTESERLANGNQTQSKDVSPSLSSSNSEGVEGSLREEEEVGLSPDGFLATSLDKAMVLTDSEIENSIQYLQIMSKKVLTHGEIVEQWEGFKIKAFVEKKWYPTRENLVNHFRDSLKLQINNGTYRKEPGESGPKPKGGKSAGAVALAGNLKQQIQSSGLG